MTLPVHYSYRIPGVARKPCCNMRNLQRLGDMVSQHTIWLQIGWTSLRSRVLASRPIFSWVFCLRITKSVHPSGGSEQSENDDQCIGTFGQSCSPDSGGQGRLVAGRLMDGWYIIIYPVHQIRHIFKTQWTYIHVCTNFMSTSRFSRFHGFNFFGRYKQFLFVFSQNSRPVTWAQYCKLNKTRKAFDISLRLVGWCWLFGPENSLPRSCWNSPKDPTERWSCLRDDED